MKKQIYQHQKTGEDNDFRSVKKGSASGSGMSALDFFYHTLPGRICLKGLTAPLLSKCSGKLMDSGISRVIIKPFIEKNHIDLSEYEKTDFASFNAFFTRQIKKSCRPVDMAPDHLIAPCDGLLSVYPIKKDTVIPAKQSAYTISRLIQDPVLSEEFENGMALVFRLCVHHYHRYIYIDDGIKGDNIFIPGCLHTVRPVALTELPVFTENSREYTVIQSENFDKMIQMEVGAMLVGKIQNDHGPSKIFRGQEKGRFLYGGSTVILLFRQNRIRLDSGILRLCEQGMEVPVKMGEKIGKAFDANGTD